MASAYRHVGIRVCFLRGHHSCNKRNGPICAGHLRVRDHLWLLAAYQNVDIPCAFASIREARSRDRTDQCAWKRIVHLRIVSVAGQGLSQIHSWFRVSNILERLEVSKSHKTDIFIGQPQHGWELLPLGRLYQLGCSRNILLRPKTTVPSWRASCEQRGRSKKRIQVRCRH